MPKLLVRIVFVILALVVLRAAYSVIPYIRDTLTLRNGGDFRGYYVAATLVRSHQNLENYAEATRDVDPVTENADPNTVFAQTAKVSMAHRTYRFMTTRRPSQTSWFLLHI
jgi:hypothetical protein